MSLWMGQTLRKGHTSDMQVFWHGNWVTANVDVSILRRGSEVWKVAVVMAFKGLNLRVLWQLRCCYMVNSSQKLMTARNSLLKEI